MTSQTFSEQTKNWVKFLNGVESCHFIGEKSTGPKPYCKPFGKLCMESNMKDFMEEQGWYLQKYPCRFFNGTPGSCTNGDECKFGHSDSPRWIKVKPIRNCGHSSYQASTRDKTSDEGSIVSTFKSASEQWPSVSQSSAPLSPGSWSSLSPSVVGVV